MKNRKGNIYMNVTTKMPHQLLKQAPPFLFIDKIIEKSENKIECVKHLTYNEPFFVGHFPGDPIVPGVLIIEMAAQASMLLALVKKKVSLRWVTWYKQKSLSFIIPVNQEIAYTFKRRIKKPLEGI